MDGSFEAETLKLLDETEEVYIETRRDAGAPEHRTVVWAVVVGGMVFARSVRARKGHWYREISANREGALLVGDTRITVRAASATDSATVEAVSEASRSKFEKSWPDRGDGASRRPADAPETFPA